MIIDADSVRTAGSAPDQIHYAATAADVTDTVVAGQHVVRDRQHRLGPVGPMVNNALARLEEQS